MKKNLPTVSVILYKSKTLANGDSPIMLRICYNGQRKYKSTGLSCSVKYWNEKKGEVRVSHPMSVQYNSIIRAQIDKVNRYIMSVEGQQDYTSQTIVKAVSKTAPTTQTLYSVFEERISYFNNVSKKHNTATGYRTLLNVIKRFKNDDIAIFDIDLSWLTDFERYLRLKYKDTSIRKFFDVLKAIMNYSAEKGYIKQSPFVNFQYSKKLDTRTRKRALTIQEITTLMQYYYDTYGWLGDGERPNLERTKVHYWNARFKPRGTTKLTPIDSEQLSLALFLCSYHFQGMAMVDLANLKKGDMSIVEVLNKEKYETDCAKYGVKYADEHKETERYIQIYTKRSKTNHPTRVVVEWSMMMPYLNPFDAMPDEDWTEEDKAEYVFPIFNKDNDDTVTKFGRMTYVNYLVNVNLQRIAKKLGLQEGITFYSARHSYASALYHANVPMGLIAQNMGRNPADIEVYLREFDVENIIDANSKALITGQEHFIKQKESIKKMPMRYSKVD